MINVTKTFLPPFEEYTALLKTAWDRAWLTNNGPMLQELETKMKDYLGVKHVFFCGNGTIAIQIALKVLGITKEVITTPFSYVATTTSLLWENCTPVFVDINSTDFNIDASKIEAAITPNTQAILAVHVYGNPCEVQKIEAIAKKHNLKVIYDGAHCFGAKYKNESILKFGDISTCSFHATKIFHTGEGGAIITDNDELAKIIYNYRSFGHQGDDYYSMGINGKNSEFHAAMGLAVFPYLSKIIAQRKHVTELYNKLLKGFPLIFPTPLEGTEINYAYYPVVFDSEKTLLKVKEVLQQNNINARRYFYPSLNNLPYHKGAACPVSESISERALSLPLYADLSDEDVHRICKLIIANLPSNNN
jgi:dTDP-4-amino-4,6-dideoxygalactose transaminase